MKKVATFLTVCLCLQLGMAQDQAGVQGLVQTLGQEPVSYATATLRQTSDSSLVKASISELDGSFVFDQLAAGTYFVEITYVGYEPHRSEALTLADGEQRVLPGITMHERSAELQEVVVKAARAIVEVHPDKTVFNVEGSINAEGSDALELLRKAPGVIVDNNEHVILQGKSGVKIYIDGKPSPLSADDLAEYLKSMQSTEIDAIEMITNPSAKYEAEGNGGIINIRLKKDKSLGTNGALSSTLRMGETAKNSNALNFNHRNTKLNVYGRYGNSIGSWANFNNILREQVGMGFDAHSDMVSDNTNHNFRLGTDFFHNDQNTFGILLSGSVSDDVWSNVAQTRIYPLTSGVTSSQLLATNEIDQDRNNFNVNANYAFDNGRGVTLNLDADYGFYRNDADSYQPNKYMDATGEVLLQERTFSSVTPTDIDIYTFRADYVRPLGKGVLGLGGKFSYVSTDNTFDFFDVADGQQTKNLERSNNFVYQENVNAGYVTYQLQSNKWNLMAGLRMEHTHSKGDLSSIQMTGNEVVERDYVDFFPSGGITFQANDHNSLRLNYSRRIDRPSYQDLNPFEFKLDELTFQKGNAFLNPQYTHSVSLSHTYKYKLTTTLSYSVTDDLITQLTDTFSRDASFITYVNLAKQKNYSLGVSYPFNVTNWWNVYTNASAYRVENSADFGGGKVVDVSANVFTFYGQNTFMLPKGYKLEVSGFYNSPAIWGGNFETDAMWAIDLGLQKKLFNDRASLKLAVTDIFKTQQWTGRNKFGALRVFASGGWESRQLRATLKYNFGNNQIKSSRSRSTGIEAEQKRVKSGN